MKIIIFDFDIEILSPHRRIFLNEIVNSNHSRINVSKIDINVFEKELLSIIEREKPNFILVDYWILFHSLLTKSDLKNFKGANIVFDNLIFYRSEIIYKILLKKLEIKKLILPWFDVHKLTTDQSNTLSFLLSRDDFYLWHLRSNDFKGLDGRKHLVGLYTNAYKKILLKFSNKIIPYIWSIDPKFFKEKIKFLDYHEFEFDFNVPGSVSSKNYPLRLKYFKSNFLNSKDSFKKITSFNKQLYSKYIVETNLNNKLELLKLMRISYFDLIKKSRLNFVDGGQMNYAVSKYLEVPICGSLIISPYSNSLNSLGFKEMVHYLKSDNQIPEVDYSFWKNECHEIRNNAYKLVISKHTNSIRIKQLYFMLNSILNSSDDIYFDYRDGDLYNIKKKMHINDF